MKQDGSDEALCAALVALREPVKAVNGTAEILLLDPPRAISVDAAGYARSREEVVPPQLIDVASREPEATLRADALDDLQVRRPDLRPLARWMDEHGALAATVVANAGEPIAVLVTPRGNRKELISLEELRAFKKLAEDFTGLCIARAALARGLARQIEASAEVDAAVQKQEQLEHLLMLEGERHRLATARLARPAAVGVYSAGARLALEALEKKTQSGAPIVVLAPLGVDPVPLVSRAHFAGARAGEPFVVVDGTSTRDHDLDRWRDKKQSPIVLADRGVLLLLDGAALPRDVQQWIGVALAERRSPSGAASSLDVQIAITTAREKVLAGEIEDIDPLLASRFGESLQSPIRLPRLDERPEDLRALVTDWMAREGVRARGDAVGIDDKAFMLLVEYRFPGGDAELVSIVRRLVAIAGNDNVVRADHVASLKLDFSSDDPEAASQKLRLV
jgi:DNA-binding NtrC family response regulator